MDFFPKGNVLQCDFDTVRFGSGEKFGSRVVQTESQWLDRSPPTVYSLTAKDHTGGSAGHAPGKPARTWCPVGDEFNHHKTLLSTHILSLLRVCGSGVQSFRG